MYVLKLLLPTDVGVVVVSNKLCQLFTRSLPFRWESHSNTGGGQPPPSPDGQSDTEFDLDETPCTTRQTPKVPPTLDKITSSTLAHRKGKGSPHLGQGTKSNDVPTTQLCQRYILDKALCGPPRCKTAGSGRSFSLLICRCKDFLRHHTEGFMQKGFEEGGKGCHSGIPSLLKTRVRFVGRARPARQRGCPCTPTTTQKMVI